MLILFQSFPVSAPEPTPISVVLSVQPEMPRGYVREEEGSLQDLSLTVYAARAKTSLSISPHKLEPGSPSLGFAFAPDWELLPCLQWSVHQAVTAGSRWQFAALLPSLPGVRVPVKCRSSQ